MKLLAPLILASLLLAGCTSNESGGDRDRDGLENAIEVDGWAIRVVTMTERLEYAVTSDPDIEDTDGDGVTDLFELALGLDPRNPDTDGDGLTDCQEVRHTVLEDCQNPNFEGETDGGYGTDASLADSDAYPSKYLNSRADQYPHYERDITGLIVRGDGISDGDEIQGITIQLPGGRERVVTSDPLLVDTDNDFLEDGYEVFEFGVDPTVVDTDGDGCEDGFDTHPDFDQAFQLGLQEFTWTEPGESGQADVVFFLSLADTFIRAPADDAFRVAHGEAFQPSGIASVKPAACTYQPTDPWVRIDVQVGRFELDGDYIGAIDVQSDTVPDGFSIWWNVREGGFAWTQDQRPGPAAPFEGVVDWSGTGGGVRFAPSVVAL